MGTGGKVAIGALVLGALGLGAWALWPKTAAAATTNKGAAPPAPSTPIVLTDTQAASLQGVSIAVNQPLILNLAVVAGGGDWSIQLSGGITANDQGISQGVHTFTVLPTGPGAAVVTATLTMPGGQVVKTFTLPVTVAPTTQSFAQPAGTGTSGLPGSRMRQALQA
jgi:hypothetical protein